VALTRPSIDPVLTLKQADSAAQVKLINHMPGSSVIPRSFGDEMSFQTKADRGKEEAVMKMPLNDVEKDVHARLVEGIDALRKKDGADFGSWMKKERMRAHQQAAAA
jgi:hypothetical protein